jgi:uncharacterized protein YdaU (DUF1376 family)
MKLGASIQAATRQAKRTVDLLLKCFFFRVEAKRRRDDEQVQVKKRVGTSVNGEEAHKQRSHAGIERTEVKRSKNTYLECEHNEDDPIRRAR